MNPDPSTDKTHSQSRDAERYAVRALAAFVGLGMGALAAQFLSSTDWLNARMLMTLGGVLGWYFGRVLRP